MNGSDIVTLETPDGGTFEIKRFHLQSASTVFEDMFSSAEMNSKDSIHIDASKDAVDVFLRMCRREVDPLSKLRKNACLDLLRLIDMYNCPSLGHMVIQRAVNDKACLFNVWELLSIASFADDDELAIEAVKRMRNFDPYDRQNSGDDATAFYINRVLDKGCPISHRYQLALLQADNNAWIQAAFTYRYSGAQSESRPCPSQMTWELVLDKFKAELTRGKVAK